MVETTRKILFQVLKNRSKLFLPFAVLCNSHQEHVPAAPTPKHAFSGERGIYFFLEPQISLCRNSTFFYSQLCELAQERIVFNFIGAAIRIMPRIHLKLRPRPPKPSPPVIARNPRLPSKNSLANWLTTPFVYQIIVRSDNRFFSWLLHTSLFELAAEERRILCGFSSQSKDGQAERIRAEGCGIADTADQEQPTVPSPVLLVR